MNILFVINELSYRGTPRCLVNCAILARQAGHQTLVWSLQEGGPSEKTCAENGIPVRIGFDALADVLAFAPRITHVHRAGGVSDRDTALLRFLKEKTGCRVLETNVFGTADLTVPDPSTSTHTSPAGTSGIGDAGSGRSGGRASISPIASTRRRFVPSRPTPSAKRTASPPTPLSSDASARRPGRIYAAPWFRPCGNVPTSSSFLSTTIRARPKTSPIGLPNVERASSGSRSFAVRTNFRLSIRPATSR